MFFPDQPFRNFKSLKINRSTGFMWSGNLDRRVLRLYNQERVGWVFTKQQK